MKEEKKQKKIEQFNNKLNSPKVIKKEFDKKVKNGLPDILLSEPFNLKRFFKEEDYRKTWSFALPHFPLDLNAAKTTNAAPKKIASKIITTLTIVSLFTSVASFAANYGPSLSNWAFNAIQASLLPPSKVNEDFNYQNHKPGYIINADRENNSTTPDATQTIEKVEINAEAQVAYSILNNVLTSTVSLYCGEDANLTPMFVFPEQRKDGSLCLKLFCKTSSNECFMFEYDVYDEISYAEIFNNPSIEVANAVNALSVLCSDENLADVPQKCILNLDENIVYGCATNVSKATEHTTVGGNYDENGNYIGGGQYVEQKYYKFNMFNLEKNGEIVGTHIKIKAEDAEALECFNENNLDALINEYKNGNSLFVKDHEFEAGNNAATIIMYNANQQIVDNQQQPAQIFENNLDF